MAPLLIGTPTATRKDSTKRLRAGIHRGLDRFRYRENLSLTLAHDASRDHLPRECSFDNALASDGISHAVTFLRLSNHLKFNGLG